MTHFDCFPCGVGILRRFQDLEDYMGKKKKEPVDDFGFWTNISKAENNRRGSILKLAIDNDSLVLKTQGKV